MVRMKRPSRWLAAAPLLLVLLAASPPLEPRYRDRRDGTVQDTEFGLIWLAHAGCFGRLPWEEAKAAVAGLGDGRCGLTDGSKPGDRRLPTKREWELMVECSCDKIALQDDLGTHCYAYGSSTFHHLAATRYWSSTPSHGGRSIEVISPSTGLGARSSPEASLAVWPVRRASP